MASRDSTRSLHTRPLVSVDADNCLLSSCWQGLSDRLVLLDFCTQRLMQLGLADVIPVWPPGLHACRLCDCDRIVRCPSVTDLPTQHSIPAQVWSTLPIVLKSPVLHALYAYGQGKTMGERLLRRVVE